MDETVGVNRRNLLLTAGAGAGVIAGAGLAQAKMTALSLTGPYLDLSTGEGNMLAKVRLDGNLDESKEKFGSATGIVAAVRPGEAVRDLFGYEVFSAGRIRKQPNGTYRFLHRETIYYTDLKSGEILFEYANPYTGETVKVVDVANDPWDELIEPYQPLAPSYGGLIKETVSRKPFLMNWSLGQNGMAVGQLHVNLFYPARLQPDKWPRESSGKMNQVSESYVYFAPLADLQNPKLTSVENNGTWSRVTPWLPWMLMGQAPGHILYNGITANFDDINRVKRNVLDHTAKYHPQMMHAPTEWSDVSLSSLEDYARTQKPAPVKTPQP
jgi:hypothetical protein